MSSKKTTELIERFQEKQTEYEEISKLVTASVEEDNKKLEDTYEQIKKIVEEKSMFCGVILDTDSLLEILKLRINTNEPVKIPFNLYFE